MRKYLLLLLSAIVFSPAIIAQEHEHTGWCKSDEVYREAYNQNPDLFKQLERELDEAVVNYGNTANKVDDGRTFYIPVVFHFLHTSSQDPTRFFSEEMADATIQRMNDDFNRANNDTSLIQPYYSGFRRGNARIKFVRAQLDPDGEATNGINYYETPLAETANRGGNDDEVKYYTYTNGKFWTPNRYLNFWVVESISQREGQTGETLAYATLPEFESSGNTRATQSGVIGKRSLYLVNPNGQFERHTLSHEVGHWLGLRHPFQMDEKSILDEEGEFTGCNDGDCKFTGDKICDIPQAYGQFLSCARNTNSCPNEPQIDNVTNIMDYRNCPAMFSRDQVIRMRGTLASYRKELVSWENLQTTGISDKIVDDIRGTATVYPNPFSDRIIIQVEVQNDVDACIEIRDVLGRSAYKDCKKKLHQGLNTIEINAGEMNLTTQGVYFVEIKMENAVLINKIQYDPSK
jgi:hypothetical protein